MPKKFFSLCLVWGIASGAAAESAAFIGDSISTGGAAHPALAYDARDLGAVFDDSVPLLPDGAYYQTIESWGLAGPSLPPRRLPLSVREFEQPLNWVYEKALHYVSHRYIDAEEYSWSYLWSRKRDLPPERILIAARDGERAEHALRQVDRLLDANGGAAPENLFFFFTGNDICAPSISLATNANDYVKNIEQAVRYYVTNAKVPESASPRSIWLVDPLAVLQIVTSPSILNHKVRAFGKELSCRDLQAGRYKPEQKPWTDPHLSPADLFLNVFGAGPRSTCSSLFAVHDAPAELQMQISQLLRAYREGLKKLVERLQVLPVQFRVRHIESTGTLQFAGDEMANDCFHLNLKGQLKVAQAIDADVRKFSQP